MEEAADKLWTKSRIIQERGWTESLIRRFLGAPDETRPNPRYRSGSPMKLYNIDRTIEAESTDEFRKALAITEKRRASAQKAAKTKRDRLTDWASSLPAPELPEMTKQELTERAIDHYNFMWRVERENFHKLASTKDDRKFLDRISVNYVRHELTRYERRILEMRGKVGKSEALEVIRSVLLSAIAKQYPWLASECARQQNQYS